MKNSKVLVLIAALLLMVTLFSACSDASIDYKEDDMSAYVTLNADLYTGAEIVVGKQPVIDETTVNNQIGSDAMSAWKWADAKEYDDYAKDTEIVDNALVFIRYYGVDEEGKGFAGGSSFIKVGSTGTVSNDPTALLIGSETFIEGFEEQLKGMIPADTAFATTKGTEIADDSVIYVTVKATYKVTDDAGEAKETTYEAWTMTNGRVDLADKDNFDADLKALVDEDFIAKAKEAKLGVEFKVEKKRTIEDSDYDVTVTATVNYVTKENAINVTFPEDYDTKELAGKDATFYVSFDGYLPFDAVAKKLGDEGKEFTVEGDKDIYTAYSEKVKGELDEAYAKTVIANRRNAIWAYLVAKAEVEVPFETLNIYYDEALENAHYEHEMTLDYYEQLGLADYAETYTFDKMMIERYGSDWEDSMHEACEAEIANRMLLHYLADALKLDVTDKEIDKALTEVGKFENLAEVSTEQRNAAGEAILWDKVTEKLDSQTYINVVEEITEEAPAETEAE